MSTLTNLQVRLALGSVAEKLNARNLKGEICILWGAAMLLAFQARQSTKDVDAIFAPTTAIREIAKEVAEEMNLPEHWLNDGVKGFATHPIQTDPEKDEEYQALRITFPTAKYLLAMKCMASSLSYGNDQHTDKEDIKFIIKETGYTTPEEILNSVETFYEKRLIQPKIQYLVEVILQEIAQEKHENKISRGHHRINPNRRTFFLCPSQLARRLQ